MPGWEGLVRRLMDQGGVELFVSGTSAKLLSREVATSLRGRALEVLVHPFSFREALRHQGNEPTKPSASSIDANRTVHAFTERAEGAGPYPFSMGRSRFPR